MKKVQGLVVLAMLVASSSVASGHEPSGKNNKLANRDALRAAVQDICPVSGNKLGAHGAPIKVKLGQEEVFLCCQGCLKGKVDPKHWATIHANFAKAQEKCPVMQQTLPKSPKWTIVQGQIVYVCCPPCTKKLAANPDKYLSMVDGYYSASLKKQTTSR